MNPTISIIVPVYNVEKYLQKCVDSILAQTFKDFEVLLIDDGSKDGSGMLCDEIATTDSRIKVIHKENGGLSSARNCGIDNATGKYIAFCDSDDYIDPDMYEFLLNNLEKEDADVSMCELYHCYSGKETYKHPADFYEVADAVRAIYIVMESRITSVTAINKLYKRELFEDGLRYVEGITAEDGRIIVDLLAKCKKVVISNAQKYYYFHRAGSITTKPLNERDYDVIDVYEYNRKRCLEIDAEKLSEVALLRQCWARFYMLDKMAISDGNYDKTREKEYIKFLKKNRMFILKNDVFTKGRRISFIALLISRDLYFKIVRKNTEKAKSVNA